MRDTSERGRRVLSHSGAIEGIDYGNISYCIAYSIMCENAPHDRCWWARKVGSANNTGNMIEASLCLARFVPLLVQGQSEDEVRRHLWRKVEPWAFQHDLEDAMKIVDAARGTTTFVESRFLPILTNAIVEIKWVIRQSPAATLFKGITRHSPAERLKQAVADFEAMRLGWPGAEWAMPGLVDGTWIILPITFYPDRQQELMNY